MTPDARAYRFTVGTIDCVALGDGLYHYPPELFFANVAQAELEEALRGRGLPVDRIATPYTILLINTGGHRVLVDTGAGNAGESAAMVHPQVDHTETRTGFLVESLAKAGLEPGDIDSVVITHGHPDHVGGTLDGIGRLVFGNAHYFMAEAEWAFWWSPRGKGLGAMTSVARRNLGAVQKRLTFVKGGFEVAPGVRLVAAHGHTPGHLALAISSGGQELYHVADTALHPLHLEQPGWSPALDMAPAEAAGTRARIFDWAANTGALVFAHHFAPFPALGRVRKRERGWEWAAVEL